MSVSHKEFELRLSILIFEKILDTSFENVLVLKTKLLENSLKLQTRRRMTRVVSTVLIAILVLQHLDFVGTKLFNLLNEFLFDNALLFIVELESIMAMNKNHAVSVLRTFPRKWYNPVDEEPANGKHQPDQQQNLLGFVVKHHVLYFLTVLIKYVIDV